MLFSQHTKTEQYWGIAIARFNNNNFAISLPVKILKAVCSSGISSTHICCLVLDTLDQISPLVNKMTTCCLFASRGLIVLPFHTRCYSHLFSSPDKNSWKSWSRTPYPRCLQSAHHTIQGSDTDLPVLHWVVLTSSGSFTQHGSAFKSDRYDHSSI